MILRIVLTYSLFFYSLSKSVSHLLSYSLSKSILIRHTSCDCEQQQQKYLPQVTDLLFVINECHLATRVEMIENSKIIYH